MKESWSKCKFDNVVDIVSGRNQKDVVSSKGKYPIYGSGGIIGRANNYLCRENTTIIGRKGNINSPMYVKEKFWNIDTAFGLESKTILESKLLFYFCLGFNFKQLDKSTAVPSLAKRDILNIEIPLPPLPEQRVLVAKIEQLFSELDNGITNLKTAQERLKIYRQAVLKKAFDLNSKKYKIEEICKEIFAGGDKPIDFFSKVKTKECTIPIIANAMANKGIYGYTKNPRVKEIAITIAGRGSGTGHVELREEPFLPIVRLITIIPKLEKVVIKYLVYFLKNLNIEKSGSAIPQLTIPMVKSFEIHLPSKQKQHQIVQQIESRLSICDKVEEIITDNIQKAEALRQSILKKAFAGELLAEAEIAACKKEKDWEPAEELLKRIKEEQTLEKISYVSN